MGVLDRAVGVDVALADLCLGSVVTRNQSYLRGLRCPLSPGLPHHFGCLLLEPVELAVRTLQSRHYLEHRRRASFRVTPARSVTVLLASNGMGRACRCQPAATSGGTLIRTLISRKADPDRGRRRPTRAAGCAHAFGALDDRCELDACRDVDLSEDVAQVGLDRLLAEEQLGRDLGVRSCGRRRAEPPGARVRSASRCASRRCVPARAPVGAVAAQALAPALSR